MTPEIPTWWLALPQSADREAIYDLFAAVIEKLPMTQAELARRLDVSRGTVNNWAKRKSRPSFSQILRTLEIVEEELREIREVVDEAQRIFGSIREITELQERYEEADELDPTEYFEKRRSKLDGLSDYLESRGEGEPETDDEDGGGS